MKRGKFIAVSLLLMLAVSCAEKPPVYPEEPTISLYDHTADTIKHIKIEEYVKGVVAAEMDPSWPENALAAQAILARTFTMKRIREGGVKAHGTDASTDPEEFQAYAPEKINQRVSRAVEKTRGLVAMYRGQYINGWFHGDSGGVTASSAVEGLNYREEAAPYVKSVEDPGFKLSPPENKSWTASFSLSEVKRAVQKAGGGDPGKITDAEVEEWGPSGRAVTVRVGRASISAPALRLALGSEKMRSTLVTGFEVRDGQLVISGKGFGHGVGMSQWGAKYLADQGWSPEEIVKFYFKDINVEKIWP